MYRNFLKCSTHLRSYIFAKVTEYLSRLIYLLNFFKNKKNLVPRTINVT